MSVSILKSLSEMNKAMVFLKNIDNDLAKVIDLEGVCRLKIDKKNSYFALLEAIAGQQLHAKAAHAILNRLKSLNSGKLPTPQFLLHLDQNQLRACGFSFRKIESLHALALATIENRVPTYEEALTLSDQDIMDRLIILPGIGRWTIEMFLIFTLGRLDIMPVDDFGVREGWRLCKNFDEQPKPKLLKVYTQSWSPYRTIGAWYLWCIADRLKPIHKQNPLTF